MTTAALPRLLSRLPGHHQTHEGQWQARCPAHDDQNESFGITLRPDGQILMHCFAGCSTDAMLASIDAKPADLAADASGTGNGKPHPPSPPPAPRIDWNARVERWSEFFWGSTAARAWLAQTLSLPECVLAAFPGIGCWNDHRDGPAYTFPERNATGEIIGVGLRFKTNKKFVAPGSNRGLSIPAGWKDCPGPLYLVEGASDVLAMTAAKLAAVGRPSNVGGVNHLADLIRAEVPADRKIVWCGENDFRPDGKGGTEWPGRDASRRAAAKLAAQCGRTIHFSLPPGDAKDVRSWLTGVVAEGGQWELIASRFVELTPGEPVGASGGGTPPGAPPTATAGGGDQREIDFEVGCDQTIVGDRVIEALVADPELFVRAECICRVVRVPANRDRGVKFPSSPRCSPVRISILRERITRCVHFMATRRGRRVVIPIPETVVQAVHDRGYWPDFRQLTAVVNYPFIRPDGTLVSESGYDEATGVYLDRTGPPPVLPDEFTLDTARAAWTKLEEAIVDFPFAKSCHRSAWLTGLLTPLARFAFDGPTPLFLIDGNTPGSGKGLLANVASLILTGQDFPTTSYSHEEEEMRKKITTIVTRSAPQVLLDNLNGTFGSASMDIVLTSTIWEDRLLGSNTSVIVPLITAWWATGNNVQISGDALRRVNHIRLESKHAKPEERTNFKHKKLKRWVLAHRAELLGHALTILVAFCRAARPQSEKMIPWGSYEDWSEMVRAAVMWLGLPDPREGREDMRETGDPVQNAMETLLLNWRHLDPKRAGLTTNKILLTVFPPKGETPEELEDVAAAITTLCARPNSHALGIRFRAWRNRTLAGLRLVQVATHANANRWCVEKAPTNSGEDGEVEDDTRSRSTSANTHNFLTVLPERSSNDHPNPHHPHRDIPFSELDDN